MMPTMNFIACTGLLCLGTVACYMMPVPEKQVGLAQSQSFPFPHKIGPSCGHGMCAGVSYNDILQLYKGLFFTEAELQWKLSEKINYTKHMQQKSGWPLEKAPMFLKGASNSKVQFRSLDHDGDHCCPTSNRYITPYAMKNTKGQTVLIVHFEDFKPEPMYQFIPRGECTYHGRCSKCLQEYAIINILVMGKNSPGYFPFEFDSVYVPSYCSCKG